MGVIVGVPKIFASSTSPSLLHLKSLGLGDDCVASGAAEKAPLPASTWVIRGGRREAAANRIVPTAFGDNWQGYAEADDITSKNPEIHCTLHSSDAGLKNNFLSHSIWKRRKKWSSS